MSNAILPVAALTATFGAGVLYMGMVYGQSNDTERVSVQVSETAGGGTSSAENALQTMAELQEMVPGGPTACTLGQLAKGAETLGAVSLAASDAQGGVTTLRVSGAPRILVLSRAPDGAPTDWRIQSAPGSIKAVVLDDPNGRIGHMFPKAPLIVLDASNPNCAEVPFTQSSTPTAVTPTPTRVSATGDAVDGMALVEMATAFRAAQLEQIPAVLNRMEAIAEGVGLPGPMEAVVAPRGETFYAP